MLSCGERTSIADGPPYRCSACNAPLRRMGTSWRATLDFEAAAREREGLGEFNSADIPTLARFLNVGDEAIRRYLGSLPEPRSDALTASVSAVAVTKVNISEKPTVEVTDDGARASIPLNVEPSDEWIRRFRSALTLPSEWTLEFDYDGMSLSGPWTDISSILDSIVEAIESANDPTATVQAEIEQWWVSHGTKRLRAEATTENEPRTHAASEVDPQPTQDEKTGGAILGWSLGLGIVSVFVGGDFGFVPISTVIVSLIAVTTKSWHPGRWLAWVGLVLGVAYTLVYLHNYGYLGSLAT